jgi:hypothetical protein
MVEVTDAHRLGKHLHHVVITVGKEGIAGIVTAYRHRHPGLLEFSQ